MKYFVYGLIVLLGVLHHDSWWWDDSDTLVLGFIPIGLAYHALISIAAGVLWGMAAKYCWPAEVDVVESVSGAGGPPRGDHA
jgi:hypothetical protein